MKKYLLLCVQKASQTPDDMSPDSMQAWTTYYNELGAKVVDGGAPFGESQFVGEIEGVKDCNKSCDMCCDTKTSGYLIISAENMEEAKMLAEKCPVIKDGMMVQVIELVDMSEMMK